MLFWIVFCNCRPPFLVRANFPGGCSLRGVFICKIDRWATICETDTDQRNRSEQGVDERLNNHEVVFSFKP